MSIEDIRRLNKKVYIRVNTYLHCDNMANITLSIPENLKLELQKHREVNWSAVTRRAMEEHIQKLHIADAIANKSKLTKKDIDELDRLIKKDIAKAHNL